MVQEAYEQMTSGIAKNLMDEVKAAAVKGQDLLQSDAMNSVISCADTLGMGEELGKFREQLNDTLKDPEKLVNSISQVDPGALSLKGMKQQMLDKSMAVFKKKLKEVMGEDLAEVLIFVLLQKKEELKESLTNLIAKYARGKLTKEFIQWVITMLMDKKNANTDQAQMQKIIKKQTTILINSLLSIIVNMLNLDQLQQGNVQNMQNPQEDVINYFYWSCCGFLAFSLAKKNINNRIVEIAIAQSYIYIY